MSIHFNTNRSGIIEQSSRPTIMSISTGVGRANSSYSSSSTGGRGIWKTGPVADMTAVQSNSVYYVKISATTQTSGNSYRKGIPFIRVKRTKGSSVNYPFGGVNGMMGRKTDSEEGGINSLNQGPNVTHRFDKSLISHIFMDSPGLTAGDTISYSLQISCGANEDDGSYNTVYAYMGGVRQGGAKTAWIEVIEVSSPPSV